MWTRALLIWLMAVPALAEGPVLVIGDSVLAFHAWTGRDIGAALERSLGREVDGEAVPGARFSNDSGLGRGLGFDVRRQFKKGDWDVVVVNGGANDLLTDCGCKACDAVVDGLIDARLQGEIPAYLTALRDRGHKVVWMGYYASYRSGQFAGCRPYIVEMETRLARFAAATPGVTFWDSEDVIDRTDRSLFAFDGIHPSPRGARVIGRALAQVIAGL